MGRLWGPVTQPKRRIKPWSQWRIWTFTCGPEHTRNRRRTSCPTSRKPLKSGGLASRANREPISALAGLEVSGIARPCTRSTIETKSCSCGFFSAEHGHPVFGDARAPTPPSAPKALLKLSTPQGRTPPPSVRARRVSGSGGAPYEAKPRLRRLRAALRLTSPLVRPRCLTLLLSARMGME